MLGNLKKDKNKFRIFFYKNYFSFNFGLMFWLNAAPYPAILRADMDGSNPRPIVSFKLDQPTGLTLDLNEDRIYWKEPKTETIESTRLDGSDRRSASIWSRSLEQDLEAIHCNVKSQPVIPEHENPCKNSNCSHICAIGPEFKPKCACPEGMVLDKSKENCVKGIRATSKKL